MTHLPDLIGGSILAAPAAYLLADYYRQAWRFRRHTNEALAVANGARS